MYNKSLTGHSFVTCCFLIFLFHLTVCTSAIAQKPITGFLYVIDSGNNIVPNIKVKVACCGNSIEGLTDERGQFKYSIPETDSCSHATVSISNSLYSPIDTVVNLRQPSRIQITLNPIKLKEVEIIAYQPVAKENAERVSFKINMKGLLKNAKADMALRSIPNIIYSDGTFRLTGKTSKAKILVNGIETTEEELTKLDAGDIDRVDLHKIGLNDDTNSGEINIILKKKSVSLYKGEIDMGGNLFKGGNITPSFTYRSKIFDLVTWLSYARERQKSRYEIVRDGNEAYSSENRSHLQQYSAMFRLNVTSSPKLMMAFSGSFFGYSSPADVDWKLNGISENPQRVKETYYSNYANLVIRYNLSHKERLFVKGRYFRYTSKNRSDNPSTQYRGNMNEATVDLLYEADSLRALKKYHSLAIGYKSIYRNSTLTSSNKKYVSDVQQLYIKDNIMLNRHWGLFLLLRNEFDGYKFEGNRTARKYSFLPSVNLNLNNRLGSFSATYTKTVERPSIDYLNPDVFYINDITKIQGNPELKSQYTSKYSLSYSKQIKNSYLTAIASFDDVSNIIGQTYSNDHNTSTYQNVGRGRTFKLDLAYNKPLLSNTLNVNMNLGWGYTEIKTDMEKINPDLILHQNIYGNFITSSLNVSYIMPKDWFLNLSMNYKSKNMTFNATYRKRPTFNLLMTKSCLKNHLDISLQWIDVLQLASKQHIDYNFKDIHQTATYKLPTSRIILSFVYRFGKQFKSRNAGRSIVNDDITTK